MVLALDARAAEAHERVHAMLVVTHALHALHELAHVRVELVLEQPGLAVSQPVQHTVEQIEAVGAAIERRQLGKLDVATWHAQ